MDFDLTEQQHAIKANFARFSDQRIAPERPRSTRRTRSRATFLPN